MLPHSDFPEPLFPSKKPLNVRLLATVLATVSLIGLFAGVLVMRGLGNTPRVASGPYATATTDTSATLATATETTVDGTPVPGATPRPTAGGTTGQQTGAVRVTQNQDERQQCMNDPTPYTVTLFNSGSVTANWHVNIPEFTGMVPSGGPAAGSRPLNSPLIPGSSSPYWASVNPQDGTVAPGQTASFVVTLIWSMPCKGSVYHASVQLSFPSGGSQTDIPLTYAGTGPVPNSNVVLASGRLNITEACPASGAAPAPFTFAIKNIGNGIAYPSVDTLKDTVGPNPWASVQIVEDPVEPVGSWLYPGETWTVTVSPRVGVRCDGTVYHTYVYITDTQGADSTMTFTDTFN